MSYFLVLLVSSFNGLLVVFWALCLGLVVAGPTVTASDKAGCLAMSLFASPFLFAWPVMGGFGPRTGPGTGR